jgi:DNA-binding response OmpR family regulator
MAMSARILIVEDSNLMMHLLECTLRARFSCFPAVTARKALALFGEGLERGLPFDLVLSDYHLPDGNGLDLAREVRAMEAARGVAAPCPLVMMSSDAVLAETQLPGGEYAIACWLTKPVLPDRVLEVVTGFLGGKGAGESALCP